MAWPSAVSEPCPARPPQRRRSTIRTSFAPRGLLLSDSARPEWPLVHRVTDSPPTIVAQLEHNHRQWPLHCRSSNPPVPSCLTVSGRRCRLRPPSLAMRVCVRTKHARAHTRIHARTRTHTCTHVHTRTSIRRTTSSTNSAQSAHSSQNSKALVVATLCVQIAVAAAARVVAVSRVRARARGNGGGGDGGDGDGDGIGVGLSAVTVVMEAAGDGKDGDRSQGRHKRAQQPHRQQYERQ